MKRILLLSILTVLLGACGAVSETTENTDVDKKEKNENTGSNVERGSLEAISRTFVQAMIDADKVVLKQIYNNPKVPLEYMLPDEGPFFAGTNIEEYIIEVTGESEVKVKRKDEEGPTYWMEVEMIGNEYYITDF